MLHPFEAEGLVLTRGALAGESHVLALLKKEQAARVSAHAAVKEEEVDDAVLTVLLSGDVEILKRRVIDGHTVDQWIKRWRRRCFCVVTSCARAFAHLGSCSSCCDT